MLTGCPVSEDTGVDVDTEVGTDIDVGTDTDTDVGTDTDAGEPAPDFALLDMNPTSPSTGEPVSPRDYLQKVSGWYYTHAN